MENDRGFHGSKENLDSNNRNNTEYIPTRCRITKPAPPKPATNPMQFVKFSPSKLLSSAKEQIKKAEEVKVVSSKIRDDAEDWQANLDNWKSCRRKRQEHIIERVVEVKKFEQQDSERTRRKSKTFYEILEEKGKRRTKLSIPIYDDDDNDLSDLGLGNQSNVKSSDNNKQIDENETFQSETKSTSTEANQQTAVRNENTWQATEVNSSCETVTSSRTASDTIAENQKMSESETICENINNVNNKYTESTNYRIENNFKTSVTYNLMNENNKLDLTDVSQNNNGSNGGQEQQYTYESAIQGYRKRVKSNLNSTMTPQFGRSEDHNSDDQETNMIVQKGSILKKRELFESDKMFEMNSYESTSSKRLQQDFVNSQSLKERLKSLEKCGAATSSTIPTPAVNTSDLTQQISSNDAPVKNRSSMLENIKSDLEKSRNKWRENSITSTSVSNNEWNSNEDNDRPASPDTNMFVDKIEKFRNSLDKLGSSCDLTGNRRDYCHGYDSYNKQPMDFESYNKEQIDFTFNKEGSDYCPPTYPALSSPVEVDLLTGTSQYCDTDREDSGIHTADVSCSVSQADEPVEDTDLNINTKFESSENMEMNNKYSPSECSLDATSTSVQMRPTVMWPPVDSQPSYPVVDYGFSVDDFPLGPPAIPLEPPKEKPPPPPKPTADEDNEGDSAARIKKEIRMKRSSFLGISSDLLDNELANNMVSKGPPTDVTSFLPLENALNRQQQLFRGAHGSFSEAGDSQDSGVEMDRAGNQISTPDGWSSGISDFEQSQQNTLLNKIYPETGVAYEEEIVKKEKEIIALVEKEEQWRVGTNKHQYRKQDLTKSYSAPKLDLLDHPISLFNESARVDMSRNDDDHFKVMQVKRELFQLEQEASLKRQKEAMRINKVEEIMNSGGDRLSNKRLSLEDITNSGMNHPIHIHQGNPDYRKSMPELQYNNAMYMNTYNVCIDNANQVHKSLVRPIRPKLPEQYDSGRPTMMGHAVGPSTDAPRLRPRSQGDLKNYNQHWLIQEAEQRRISNQMYQSSAGIRCDSWKLTKPDKHLPDSVIQTLTNRLQKKLLMPQPHQRIDNLPVYNPHHPVSGQLHHSQPMEESQDKMLSVSGKKKCSYCENELGRGAAMIIESLCLFYHMECFKCCVCHVQLGDGRMGTDVRVRNSKLHCHNCYSSDDGVKFSCV